MGQPEFQQIVAQAPRKSLVVMLQTKTTGVAVGVTESVYMYAPSGYIAKLINMNLNFPKMAGAVSGNHAVYVSFSTGSGYVAQGLSNFDKDLIFDYGHFYGATSTIPADVNVLSRNVKTTEFDDVTGILFQYQNNLNVAQTNARTYSLTVIKEQVAS